MIESELKKHNYTKGGNNYVLLSNSGNRWVAFSKKIIDRLLKTYNEDFNLIVYWNSNSDIEYFKIPYSHIKHLLTEEHLSDQKDGSLRWTFTVSENLFCVHANANFSINITNCINQPLTRNLPSNSLTGKSSYIEGERKFKLHRVIERDSNLIKDFKAFKSKSDHLLCCEICGFSFHKKYGEIGIGFIEAHHLKPISLLDEMCETKFEDLILVCSNCHSMLHRQNPPLTVNELKKALI